MGNCFYRNKTDEEIKNEYKKLSDDELENVYIDCKHKYNKHCCLGISYGIASSGSSIATCMTGPKAALATVPAAVVSGLACVDNLKEASDAKAKKLIIRKMIKERYNYSNSYEFNKSI